PPQPAKTGNVHTSPLRSVKRNNAHPHDETTERGAYYYRSVGQCNRVRNYFLQFFYNSRFPQVVLWPSGCLNELTAGILPYQTLHRGYESSHQERPKRATPR